MNRREVMIGAVALAVAPSISIAAPAIVESQADRVGKTLAKIKHNLAQDFFATRFSNRQYHYPFDNEALKEILDLNEMIVYHHPDFYENHNQVMSCPTEFAITPSGRKYNYVACSREMYHKFNDLRTDLGDKAKALSDEIYNWYWPTPLTAFFHYMPAQRRLWVNPNTFQPGFMFKFRFSASIDPVAINARIITLEEEREITKKQNAEYVKEHFVNGKWI